MKQADLKKMDDYVCLELCIITFFNSRLQYAKHLNSIIYNNTLSVFILKKFSAHISYGTC